MPLILKNPCFVFGGNSLKSFMTNFKIQFSRYILIEKHKFDEIMSNKFRSNLNKNSNYFITRKQRHTKGTTFELQ